MNPFQFVTGNPITGTDPSGLIGPYMPIVEPTTPGRPPRRPRPVGSFPTFGDDYADKWREGPSQTITDWSIIGIGAVFPPVEVADDLRYFIRDPLDPWNILLALPFGLDKAFKNSIRTGKALKACPTPKHTPNQRALKDLVDEATKGKKKLSRDDAETILDWAEEVNYPDWRAKPGDVGGGHWIGPHIHLPGTGKKGHVPVAPGVPPRINPNLPPRKR